MKFNVKLPGADENSEKKPGGEQSSKASSEAKSGPVLKKKPRIALPVANEEITVADEVATNDYMPNSVGEVEDESSSEVPVEVISGEASEPALAKGESKTEKEEDQAAVDVGVLKQQWRESLQDDALASVDNPLLDDDEDEDWAGVGETSSEGGVKIAEDEAWNPLLDDDEDEENMPFAGLNFGAKGRKRTVELNSPSGEGEHASDNFASQSEEFAEPVVVTMPAKPAPTDRDRANLAKKAAKEAARDAKNSSLKSKKLGLKSNFEAKPTYEVVVDADGRERSKASPAAVEEEAPSADAGGEGRKVLVLSEDGTEKWVAQDGPSAGKPTLSSSELRLFSNLNRKKSEVLTDGELKSAFARHEARASKKEQQQRDRLVNRAIFGDDALKAGSRKRFTEKDRDTLRFIGMFKYANARHVARIFQVSEDTMTKRLGTLAQKGLVLKKEIYGARPLWYLTEGGLVCSGLEVPRVKESGITYTMLPHQFVINHTAGNLWGGGVNVLNLEDFPARNRRRENGEYVMGETVVSELEIQSSFSQIKINHKADTYRPIVTGEREKQFRLWQEAGGVKFGPSPEQIQGNEYMWTLIPPMSLRLAYHVPDLVVKRPRHADGSPASIAVEIELANKPYAAYERALNAYRFDSTIYGQVIWVVKSRGAARKLEEAARKIGLWDDEKVDIVPIFTEDGVFKSKPEWTL